MQNNLDQPNIEYIDDIDFCQVNMQPCEVEYVIYHGNCSDGFGSALCAHIFFKELDQSEKNKPVYHPGKFGILPPLDDIKNKCVLICDFSYKKDQLQKLLSVVKKLLILDHHKTAKDDLKDLPDENKVFRMDHSGAYITWRYFFRNRKVPLGIRYIEDNDIWKKEMPNTYEFTAFMFALPFTFDAYERLLDDEYINKEVFSQGIGMVKQNNNIISKSVKFAAPKFVQIKEKYYFVAHLNTTELKSEIGHKAFVEHPNINFSVMYSHNDYHDSTSFSLRSLDTATDVSEIAKLFGGGGHRNASGANCNYVINTLPVTIIDNHKSYFLLNNIYEISSTNEGNILNTIYLNSSHFKHQLVKYLLQVRYTTTDGLEVQECSSIINNRNTGNKLEYKKYDVSVVWNYDGCNDCTWFTVSYIDPLLKNVLIQKFKDYDNFDVHDDVLVFSQKFMRTYLETL